MNGAVRSDSSGEGCCSSNPPAQEILSNMDCLRKSGDFCDVTLDVDGVKYPAHKVVLAGLSPYFKALFAGGFSESKEPSVKMEDIDASAMNLVLEYGYGKSPEITFDNVQNLLHAANFLQIIGLFDQCATFLESNLNSGNCLGILNLAKIYLNHNLSEKANEYALKNFNTISEKGEFLELDRENLINLIGNDSLEANEVQVFKSVIRWLSYNEEERSPALPQVLAQVRLAHIPMGFLYDRVDSIQAIRSSPDCMLLLERARWYQALANRKLELQSSVSRRRRQWSQVEVMLMYFEKKGTQSKYMIGLAEDGRVVKTITTPPDIASCYTSNLQSECVGIQYESMYRCGDWQNSQNWNVMPSMPRNRHWFGFVELDRCYYAIGGIHTEKGVSNNMDQFDVMQGHWKVLANLPTPVYYPGVVALRGMIYVLGGLDGHRQSTNTVQRYDPESNTWTELAPLPVKRGEFSACAMHDRIYVCQFFSNIDPVDMNDDSRHVYMYKPSINKWTSCAKLSHAFVSGPVPFNGNMFVLTERSDKERVLEKYDPSTTIWKDFAGFRGYLPRLITGPVLIARPATEYDPKGPLNFVQLIK